MSESLTAEEYCRKIGIGIYDGSKNAGPRPVERLVEQAPPEPAKWVEPKAATPNPWMSPEPVDEDDDEDNEERDAERDAEFIASVRKAASLRKGRRLDPAFFCKDSRCSDEVAFCRECKSEAYRRMKEQLSEDEHEQASGS